MLPATPPIIDPRLLADVKSSEGCKLTAYRDTRGNWTIGYGHLLDQTIDWTGHTITQATADGLLAQDLAVRQQQCEGLPEWSALDTACRQNAVTESVFNLGLGHWRCEFPATRSALAGKQWALAATNLLASPEWIAQVGKDRVARLAGYLSSGSYGAPPDSA